MRMVLIVGDNVECSFQSSGLPNTANMTTYWSEIDTVLRKNLEYHQNINLIL